MSSVLVHHARPDLLEQPDLVPAGVTKQEARAVGDLNAIGLAAPPRPLQGLLGRLDVLDGPDGKDAGSLPVIGQKDQRPLCQPDRGHLRPHRSVMPDDLARELVAVEGHVARHVVRADVQVHETLEETHRTIMPDAPDRRFLRMGERTGVR
jgi:hypothetical protein